MKTVKKILKWVRYQWCRVFHFRRWVRVREQPRNEEGRRFFLKSYLIVFRINCPKCGSIEWRQRITDDDMALITKMERFVKEMRTMHERFRSSSSFGVFQQMPRSREAVEDKDWPDEIEEKDTLLDSPPLFD